MTDLFGPLPRHAATSLPLILSVLAPLGAALVTALGERWMDDAARSSGAAGRSRGLASTIATTGALLALVVVGVGVASALGSGSGLALSPAWVILRTGSIDGAAGLDVDLTRGAVAFLLAAAATIHAWRNVKDARSATATSMAVATGLCAVLADGLAMAIVALGGALATAAASGTAWRWARGASAVGLLLLGGAALAWGLEGQWLRGLSGEYLSDYAPRFAAVRDSPPKGPRQRGQLAAEGRGTLTMTSTPGAEVYVGIADDVSLRTRRTPLATSPFRGVEVPAVLQKIAIVPGGAAVVGGEGTEVALLDAVDVRAGEEVVLQPIGATWTWRDLDAQLALRDVEGKHPLRSAFGAKRLGFAALPTAILLLLFAAAFAALADAPSRLREAMTRGGRGEAGLLAAAVGLAAIVPVARAGSLVPLANAGALVAVAVGLVLFGVRAALPFGSWMGPGAAAASGGAALLAITADAPAAAAPLVLAGAALAFFTAPGPKSEEPVAEATHLTAPSPTTTPKPKRKKRDEKTR